MKELIFYVSYDNNIHKFETGVEAMIFDCGVSNDFDYKYGFNALKEYVALVKDLYFSDDNPTPLGRLCDYVAKHWKKVRRKSKCEILSEFYLTI